MIDKLRKEMATKYGTADLVELTTPEQVKSVLLCGFDVVFSDPQKQNPVWRISDAEV